MNEIRSDVFFKICEFLDVRNCMILVSCNKRFHEFENTQRFWILLAKRFNSGINVEKYSLKGLRMKVKSCYIKFIKGRYAYKLSFSEFRKITHEMHISKITDLITLTQFSGKIIIKSGESLNYLSENMRKEKLDERGRLFIENGFLYVLSKITFVSKLKKLFANIKGGFENLTFYAGQNINNIYLRTFVEKTFEIYKKTSSEQLIGKFKSKSTTKKKMIKSSEVEEYEGVLFIKLRFDLDYVPDWDQSNMSRDTVITFRLFRDDNNELEEYYIKGYENRTL